MHIDNGEQHASRKPRSGNVMFDYLRIEVRGKGAE